MKKRILIGVISIALFTTLPGRADVAAGNGSLPGIVERGLSAFKVNGGRLAIENWTRGGPLEDSRGAAVEVESIEKLEDLYGRYQGHSVIGQVNLGPSSSIHFLEIQLEEGPVYIRLQVFVGRTGERIVGVTVDAVPERILPPYIMEKRVR